MCKLQTLKHLDEEVLALMDDEAEVLADIEEADTCTQRIYQQLVRIDTHRLSSKCSHRGSGYSCC